VDYASIFVGQGLATLPAALRALPEIVVLGLVLLPVLITGLFSGVAAACLAALLVAAALALLTFPSASLAIAVLTLYSGAILLPLIVAGRRRDRIRLMRLMEGLSARITELEAREQRRLMSIVNSAKPAA
jgi:hypothetical protein